MLGFGSTPCVFCFRRVSPTGAIRSLDRRDLIVCRACYEQWDGAGRRCGQCGKLVQREQHIGVFLKPRGAFGHVECGGIHMVHQ